MLSSIFPTSNQKSSESDEVYQIPALFTDLNELNDYMFGTQTFSTDTHFHYRFCEQQGPSAPLEWLLQPAPAPRAGFCPSCICTGPFCLILNGFGDHACVFGGATKAQMFAGVAPVGELPHLQVCSAIGRRSFYHPQRLITAVLLSLLLPMTHIFQSKHFLHIRASKELKPV